jgi:hypothetical protein
VGGKGGGGREGGEMTKKNTKVEKLIFLYLLVFL